MDQLTRRRLFTRAAPAAGAGAIAGAALLRAPGAAAGSGAATTHGATHETAATTGAAGKAPQPGHGSRHAAFRGKVDHRKNGFDPHEILRDFDWGTTRKGPDGRTIREWEIVAADKEIEVAPGVVFPAWTYNGRIPGPTLRANEDDLLRITFINGSAHPHTMHFHGIHPSSMDGVAGQGAGDIQPGDRTVYEFDATPAGLHLYHCHVRPLAEHIAKGLYGAFIVDPKGGREDADEMVMVLNGFDTNFDRANEVYAVNTIGFTYMDTPIQVEKDKLVRIYLVNVLEYDLINSFHLHGNFFDWYPTGTGKTPSEFTDTVMFCQGQRGIAEMRIPNLGKFMFHAHQSEFTELGWQSLFEVCERGRDGKLVCDLSASTDRQG
ncbi:multicopper oxidase domain-containing protein [Conexibacter sp. W3-3-2]|uniref:multicopper oxidase domain-containing protein n=1 Tax=Conexibacter sp. W3-3-2 TaxID=2675227 RepID=UPI002814F794|nr:multicopper oxidase domain-containing protein [Conexibacter sp. W3-3-2]